jgi:SAM-dependent methyltransferase
MAPYASLRRSAPAVSAVRVLTETLAGYGAAFRLPGDAVLEIGCGTGKATQHFARRGLRILALEPGPEMISAARRRLADLTNVRFVETTFEAWKAEPAAYKLVAAAQSWPWVAPQIRFAKAADALAPSGVLAVFGNAPVGVASPLREALERIHQSYAPRLAGPLPENRYLPSGPVAGLFGESQRFGPLTHGAYFWCKTQDTRAISIFCEAHRAIRCSKLRCASRCSRRSATPSRPMAGGSISAIRLISTRRRGRLERQASDG